MPSVIPLETLGADLLRLLAHLLFAKSQQCTLMAADTDGQHRHVAAERDHSRPMLLPLQTCPCMQLCGATISQSTGLNPSINPN